MYERQAPLYGNLYNLTFQTMPHKQSSLKFNQFERVLETISDQIVVFDAGGNFIYGNNAARKANGLESLETGETSLKELYRDVEFRDVHGQVIPPGEYPSVKANRGIATQGNIFQYINKKTGVRTWYETNATPIPDAQGKTSYVIISYQDITEKKIQEDKLRFLVNAFKILSGTLDFNVLLNEIAKLMVPTLADWSAIDIVSSDGSPKRVAVVHQNPKMIALVKEVDKHFPPDPNAPTGLYHVIKTGQPDFIPEITEEMIAQGVTDEAALRLLRKLNLVSVITVPIAARGKILGALTLVQAESGRHYTKEDIEFASDFCNHIGILLDNAKLYQEVESQNQTKERFLAILSHELRNPLAPIVNSLELLQFKNIEDPEMRNEIEVMNRQFKYMEKLLRDLLEVSRLTSGTISLEKAPLDLKKTVEEAVDSIKLIARQTELTVHISVPDHPTLVVGDSVRVAQIVNNLLDNAIKFTPPGGSIWITLDSDGKKARVSVKDNGIGIKPELLPRIFDLYAKGERQGSDKLNNGLGIGLVLVQKLLDLHGATIVAKSGGIGYGSEFIIEIPMLARSPEEKTSEPPARKGNKRISQKRKVLIVDDNQDAANALSKLLTFMGAETHTAYSATEGLAAVPRIDPDVIILDIGMPDMNGYQLARSLREKGFSKIIVALTGYGQREDKQKAKDAGFDRHLTKPARSEDLKKILLLADTTARAVR